MTPLSRHPGEGRGPEPQGRRLRLWAPAFAGVTLFFAATALADSNLPPADLAYTQLADPAQEAKAKALMDTLRCLVCQGQSIADSDAELAGDMRSLVRERIARGESPDHIRAWMIGRYGNWVSYQPPVQPVTWPLWITPLVLLGLGAWLARSRLKRRVR